MRWKRSKEGRLRARREVHASDGGRIVKRVGLIGPPDREELARLAMRLEERGAVGVLLDSAQDPDIVLTRDSETAYGESMRDFSGFFVADLGVRPVLRYFPDGRVDENASKEARKSSQRHLATWFALLHRLSARSRVVNPPQTFDLHALKPWEMSGYARAELPIPRTVATSDSRMIQDLPGGPGVQWIQKGMVGGYGYTEAFEPPESDDAAEEILSSAPRMIQERVQGDNVRAFVLDGKVIGAAEIASFEGSETDSRRGDVRVRRLQIPAEAEAIAIKAAGRWGLKFAAVDFMVEAGTHRHILLECNSAPFFLSFEQQTGWDISSRLADYLIGRRR